MNNMTERSQRGQTRAQRMLEEENRQLMQALRMLQERNRQAEDRLRETENPLNQVQLPPPVMNPMDTSHLRGSASDAGGMELVMHFAQERELSGLAVAGYHSPDRTPPDLDFGNSKDELKEDRQDIEETQKKVGSLEELQMSLIDSPMIMRAAKEDTATLKAVSPDIVETKDTEKDSLYGDTEDGPIDKGNKAKQDNVRPEGDEKEYDERVAGNRSKEDTEDPFEMLDYKTEDIQDEPSEEEIEPEQKDMLERLHILAMEEEMIDKENEQKAKEEAQITEMLKHLKYQTAALEAERERVRRLEEMKQEEERREKRIQLKIKKQRENEERIINLQREEERLRKLEEMKQVEEKRQKLLDLRIKMQEEEKLIKMGEMEREGQKQAIQLNAKLEEKRKQDERLAMLKLESDKLKEMFKCKSMEDGAP